MPVSLTLPSQFISKQSINRSFNSAIVSQEYGVTDYASGVKLFSSKEHLRDVEALLPLVGTWARTLISEAESHEQEPTCST